MQSRTTFLSIAAIIAIATLVIGISTAVGTATSAYASSNTKQAKVVVINKCANVDDENKRVHTENVRCEINHDTIQGTGFSLVRDNVKIESTK